MAQQLDLNQCGTINALPANADFSNVTKECFASLKPELQKALMTHANFDTFGTTTDVLQYVSKRFVDGKTLTLTAEQIKNLDYGRVNKADAPGSLFAAGEAAAKKHWSDRHICNALADPNSVPACEQILAAAKTIGGGGGGGGGGGTDGGKTGPNGTKPAGKKHSGGIHPAAIAVPIVVVLLIIVGVLVFIWMRKRRAADEEMKSSSYVDEKKAGSRKPSLGSSSAPREKKDNPYGDEE